MNRITHLFKYRTLPALLSRAIKILGRYGMTGWQFHNRLQEYINLMHLHNCGATFPITANILKRNHALIEEFSGNGVEFAIHGYVHSDYTDLSLKNQVQDIEEAIKTFRTFHIPFAGFRFPYLKWNDEVLEVVNLFNFSWDSSQSVIWKFFTQDLISTDKRNAYQKILAYYQPGDAHNSIVRPTFKCNLVEIPVSLPDDEILIDTLGIIDEAIIENTWTKILKETYHRGEIFTLQLHPERFFYCTTALASVLKQAESYNPRIWITQLGNIANWWKERREFRFEVYEEQQHRYNIDAVCSQKATVLGKNIHLKTANKEDFIDGYRIIDTKHFTIESVTRPVIGISQNCARELQDFITEEGFPCEVNDHRERYGIYFKNYYEFNTENEKHVLNTINQSSAPLIRFWRWPEKAKSALAITGDIDAMTSIDFIMRAFGK